MKEADDDDDDEEEEERQQEQFETDQMEKTSQTNDEPTSGLVLCSLAGT